MGGKWSLEVRRSGNQEAKLLDELIIHSDA